MHTSYNGQRLRLKNTNILCVYILTNYIVFACYLIMFRIMAINQQKDIHCVQPQMLVVISCSDYISTGLKVVLGKVSINEIESLHGGKKTKVE